MEPSIEPALLEINLVVVIKLWPTKFFADFRGCLGTKSDEHSPFFC